MCADWRWAVLLNPLEGGGEVDSDRVGAGGLVEPGSEPSPLLHCVEASFDDVAPLDESAPLQDSRMAGVCPKEPSNPISISVREHSALGFRHRICHFLDFEGQASGFDDSALIGDAKAYTNALWPHLRRSVHAKYHPGGPVGVNIERLQPAVAGDQAGTGYLKNLAYSKSRPSRWPNTCAHTPIVRETELSPTSHIRCPGRPLAELPHRAQRTLCQTAPSE